MNGKFAASFAINFPPFPTLIRQFHMTQISPNLNFPHSHISPAIDAPHVPLFHFGVGDNASKHPAAGANKAPLFHIAAERRCSFGYLYTTHTKARSGTHSSAVSIK